MVMYGVKTARRSYEWTDIRTLSESALPVNPTNAKVYMTIGNHYAQEVSWISQIKNLCDIATFKSLHALTYSLP